MNNKNNRRYEALVAFMEDINKECGVFQDNLQVELTLEEEKNIRRKYYAEYAVSL